MDSVESPSLPPRSLQLQDFGRLEAYLSERMRDARVASGDWPRSSSPREAAATAPRSRRGRLRRLGQFLRQALGDSCLRGGRSSSATPGVELRGGQRWPLDSELQENNASVMGGASSSSDSTSRLLLESSHSQLFRLDWNANFPAKARKAKSKKAGGAKSQGAGRKKADAKEAAKAEEADAKAGEKAKEEADAKAREKAKEEAETKGGEDKGGADVGAALPLAGMPDLLSDDEDEDTQPPSTSDGLADTQSLSRGTRSTEASMLAKPQLKPTDRRHERPTGASGSKTDSSAKVDAKSTKSAAGGQAQKAGGARQQVSDEAEASVRSSQPKASGQTVVAAPSSRAADQKAAAAKAGGRKQRADPDTQTLSESVARQQPVAKARAAAKKGQTSKSESTTKKEDQSLKAKAPGQEPRRSGKAGARGQSGAEDASGGTSELSRPSALSAAAAPAPSAKPRAAKPPNKDNTKTHSLPPSASGQVGAKAARPVARPESARPAASATRPSSTWPSAKDPRQQRDGQSSKTQKVPTSSAASLASRSEPGARTASQQRRAMQPRPKPKPTPKPKPKPTGSQSKPKPKPTSQAQPKPKPTSQAQPKPKPTSQAQPKPKPTSQAQPKPLPRPNASVQPGPRPAPRGGAVGDVSQLSAAKSTVLLKAPPPPPKPQTRRPTAQEAAANRANKQLVSLEGVAWSDGLEGLANTQPQVNPLPSDQRVGAVQTENFEVANDPPKSVAVRRFIECPLLPVVMYKTDRKGELQYSEVRSCPVCMKDVCCQCRRSLCTFCQGIACGQCRRLVHQLAEIKRIDPAGAVACVGDSSAGARSQQVFCHSCDKPLCIVCMDSLVMAYPINEPCLQHSTTGGAYADSCPKCNRTICSRCRRSVCFSCTKAFVCACRSSCSCDRRMAVQPHSMPMLCNY